MEPDLVAAMAEAVEQLQLRRVLVRQPALLDGLGSAKLRAIGRKPVIRPAGTVDRGGILQRMVGGEEVVILQRRRLVQHLGGVAGDRRGLGYLRGRGVVSRMVRHWARLAAGGTPSEDERG